MKFVTQTDGSMDLLMKLAEQKAKSIAYIFNNKKIRKIIMIQRRKENILSVVAKLKEKIVRWRKFTKTTLDVDEGRSYKELNLHLKDEKAEKSDQLKEPLIKKSEKAATHAVSHEDEEQ
jgi:hypothetical protein